MSTHPTPAPTPTATSQKSITPPVSMLHRFKPGRFTWLLAHEMRVQSFELASLTSSGKEKTNRRGLSITSMVLLAAFFILLHFLFGGLLGVLFYSEKLDPNALIRITGGVVYFLILFSLFTLPVSCIKYFFEKRDVNIYLASPIHSYQFMQVKLVTIALTNILMLLYFCAPVANAAALHTYFSWLAIYPTLCAIGLILTCVSMLLCVGLVRWLGTQKANLTIQILCAILSGGIPILAIIANELDADTQKYLLSLVNDYGWHQSSHWIYLPARAALGHIPDLLILCALAWLVFWLTTHLSHRTFLKIIQGFNDISPTKKKSRANYHPQPFETRIFPLVFKKEWRLILRAPKLISQVGSQVMGFLPLCFIILRNESSGAMAYPLATFLTAWLAALFLQLMIHAEEARDLLEASPVGEKRLVRYKVLSVVLPSSVMVCLVACLVLIQAWSWLELWRAMLFLALSLTAITLSAYVQLWYGVYASRTEFNKRLQENIASNFINIFCNALWAVAVYVLLYVGWMGLIVVGFNIVLYSLIFLLRRNRY